MKKPPGLNAAHSKFIMKVMSRVQTFIYQKTDGKVGGRFLNNAPVAILTTTGRKSGLERSTPLLYLVDGKNVIVVASQAGRDGHPMWYLNLKADPSVKVQIGGTTSARTARTASESEKTALWPKLTQMYPDFDSYQSWTDRNIPVVILEPR